MTDRRSAPLCDGALIGAIRCQARRLTQSIYSGPTAQERDAAARIVGDGGVQ